MNRNVQSTKMRAYYCKSTLLVSLLLPYKIQCRTLETRLNMYVYCISTQTTFFEIHIKLLPNAIRKNRLIKILLKQ